MTKVRTAKTSYKVVGIEAPSEGPHALVVRQPSGKKKTLILAEVGRPRFDSAVANFRSEQQRERAAK
jgi:hypothetical protein